MTETSGGEMRLPPQHDHAASRSPHSAPDEAAPEIAPSGRPYTRREGPDAGEVLLEPGMAPPLVVGDQAARAAVRDRHPRSGNGPGLLIDHDELDVIARCSRGSAALGAARRLGVREKRRDDG